MISDESEAIIAYIRQWQETYTREAITQQLRDAGYNPAAIDAAWTRVDAEAPPHATTAQGAPAERQAPGPLSTGRAIAAFAIIWLGILAVLGVLQTLTAIVLGSLSPSTYNPQLLGVLNVLFVVLVLGLLAGGIFFLVRRQSLGRVLAVVGVLAFVWFVVVAGICFTA